MKESHQGFVERFGRFFEDNGLPRMAGRALAHLLTCNPPEQTFDELVKALGASRSTVSVASRLTVQLGLVERFGIPGDRRDRYRIREDAWSRLLEQDLATSTQLKKLADDGLHLLASQPASTRARLRAMREFYLFLEEAYAPILARWQKRQRRRSP
jgi:DNA-binding MarR family transcriptional regulator